MLTLESQVRAVQARVEKNIRFGVARGLTQTAQHANKTVGAQLPYIFDRPTPFTLNSLGIKAATKTELTSSVFVKNAQADYLALEETGGLRQPRPGSPINIPVRQRTNVFGNIGRGKIGEAKAKKSVFVSNGQGRTAHLPPGLYERLGNRKKKGLGSKRGRRSTTGRGKQQTRVKLLVAFDKKATYQPRFGFRDRAAKAANAVLKDNVATFIVAAVNSMGTATGALSP